MAKRLDAHLAWLAREIGRVEADIETTTKGSPLRARTSALLDAVPGVGAAIIARLIAELPELGHLSRHKMAALVAFRHNPSLRAFHQGPLARAKARGAALTALMRKLLTILRDRSTWRSA